MKLAVFDCDGTLVDSQANILRAMEGGFRELNLPPPEPDAVRRIVGLNLNEAAAVLLPEANTATHQRLADAYRAAFRQLRARSALEPEPLFDGIRALLDRLAGDGWLLAVATGKSDRGLQLCLQQHGLQHLFISLQTADRHPSKPHPSMLLQCLADAGVAAADACIVGDTAFDMAMGKAARVRGIGVGWGHHPPAELLAAGAIGVAGNSDQLHELIHAGA